MEIFGKIVDVFAREIYDARIIYEDGLIVSVDRVNVACENYILPGLIDSHIHIESSMCTPSSFARAVVPRGTTTVVSDPHEIANVLGVAGVDYMIEDAKRTPLKVCFGAPSCVPATMFETTGSVVSSGDIESMFRSGKVKYLSEMMNYPGVLMSDKETINKIGISLKYNMPIDGHAPGLSGVDLKRYIDSGISTDHECTSIDEAEEKISLGMKILIREGSAARNLDALKDLIKKYPEKVMLCSDDLHPEMLINGHVNLLVARLIGEGFDLFDVIKSCTLNPANHYNLDTGALIRGKAADFIVVNNLETMNVTQTVINGQTVYKDNAVLFDAVSSPVINSFNCSHVLSWQVKVMAEGTKMKIIEAIDGSLVTRQLSIDVAEGEEVSANAHDDVLKIVVKDRYRDAKPAVGFIKGFGLKSGAFASSVAHDSHNIVAIGTNDVDLCKVINQIINMRGGMAVSYNGEIESFALPVAGIMSNRSVAETALSYEKLSTLVKLLGCSFKAPFMTLSFMALPVIPELKISDKGLFDVNDFKLVSAFDKNR